MRNLFKLLSSLCAAILIVFFLRITSSQPAEIFAQTVPSLTPTVDPCLQFDVVCPTPTVTPTATPTTSIPLITIDNVTVNENAGTADFTVTNTLPYNPDSSGTFVTYYTQDGTAVSPNDYTETNSNSGNRIQLRPGESATISVPIIDDSITENTETFSMNISYIEGEEQFTNSGTGTIIDNDTPPTPGSTGGDGLSDGLSSCPDCTKPPKTTPTPQPTTRPDLGINLLPILPTEEVKGDKVEPSVTPTPLPTITPTPKKEVSSKQENRSILVKSILSPNEIPVNGKLVLLSLVSTALLVLLLVFPSELFNSTVQSNYDEIMRWSLVHRVKAFYERVNHMPSLIVVVGFAVLGAIINSFLSPDFGFNKPTITLVIGMLLALAIISIVYDVSRSFYMKRRFGQQSKLRAHSIGLVTGALLVTISRFANFLPGYCFGIFTALVFKEEPNERKNGEGLAFASVALIVVALIGWFAWIPVKQLATSSNPNFLSLVIDAAFSTLWVSTLTSTVFGLLPMRFMYGETIKHWNSKIWAVIYFTGVFLFVYTLLNPAVGIYGKSDKVSWAAVLALFFAFGIFSLGFWGYFRYKYLWHRSG